MNTPPTPVVGSTVQLLTPFLSYRIDVLVAYGNDRPAERALLLGALLADGRQGELVRVKFYSDGKRRWVDPKHVRPVLRSFADLLIPLPDDSIPAVEVVRNLYPREVNLTAELVHNWIEIKSDRTLLYYFWQADLPASKLSLWAAEYLRRHRFAVGLQADQFSADHAY